VTLEKNTTDDVGWGQTTKNTEGGLRLYAIPEAPLSGNYAWGFFICRKVSLPPSLRELGAFA
jgi:hypothetical protein